jgi:hypothetical protein
VFAGAGGREQGSLVYGEVQSQQLEQLLLLHLITENQVYAGLGRAFLRTSKYLRFLTHSLLV